MSTPVQSETVYVSDTSQRLVCSAGCVGETIKSERCHNHEVCGGYLVPPEQYPNIPVAETPPGPNLVEIVEAVIRKLDLHVGREQIEEAIVAADVQVMKAITGADPQNFDGTGKVSLDLSTFGVGKPWPMERVFFQVLKELKVDPHYFLLLLAAATRAGAKLEEPIKFAEVLETMRAMGDAFGMDLSEMEVIVEEGGGH